MFYPPFQYKYKFMWMGKASLSSLIQVRCALVDILLFNKKLTVRVYVDDVINFVSHDEDFTRVGPVLDLFCQWTKRRMNKNKTKALGLGT